MNPVLAPLQINADLLADILGEVPRPLEHGAGGGPDADPHLLREEDGKRGLPQPRRPEEQRVVQRVPAPPGRVDREGELACARFEEIVLSLRVEVRIHYRAVGFEYSRRR